MPSPNHWPMQICTVSQQCCSNHTESAAASYCHVTPGENDSLGRAQRPCFDCINIPPLGRGCSSLAATHPSMQEIARLGRAYAEDMRRWLPASEANTTYIVNKMLGNVWNLWLIAVMLPDACLVHTVRHPLDTALSCFQQAFGHPGMSWALDIRGGQRCKRAAAR